MTHSGGQDRPQDSILNRSSRQGHWSPESHIELSLPGNSSGSGTSPLFEGPKIVQLIKRSWVFITQHLDQQRCDFYGVEPAQCHPLAADWTHFMSCIADNQTATENHLLYKAPSDVECTDHRGGLRVHGCTGTLNDQISESPR